MVDFLFPCGLRIWLTCPFNRKLLVALSDPEVGLSSVGIVSEISKNYKTEKRITA